jgi:hypothetical protein
MSMFVYLRNCLREKVVDLSSHARAYLHTNTPLLAVIFWSSGSRLRTLDTQDFANASAGSKQDGTSPTPASRAPIHSSHGPLASIATGCVHCHNYDAKAADGRYMSQNGQEAWIRTPPVGSMAETPEIGRALVESLMREMESLRGMLQADHSKWEQAQLRLCEASTKDAEMRILRTCVDQLLSVPSARVPLSEVRSVPHTPESLFHEPAQNTAPETPRGAHGASEKALHVQHGDKGHEVESQGGSVHPSSHSSLDDGCSKAEKPSALPHAHSQGKLSPDSADATHRMEPASTEAGAEATWSVVGESGKSSSCAESETGSCSCPGETEPLMCRSPGPAHDCSVGTKRHDMMSLKRHHMPDLNHTADGVMFSPRTSASTMMNTSADLHLASEHARGLCLVDSIVRELQAESATHRQQQQPQREVCRHPDEDAAAAPGDDGIDWANAMSPATEVDWVRPRHLAWHILLALSFLHACMCVCVCVCI